MVLSLSTTDVRDQIIHATEVVLRHCRLFSNILGFYLPDANSILPLQL